MANGESFVHTMRKYFKARVEPYRANDGTTEWAEHITAQELKIRNQLVENLSLSRDDCGIFHLRLGKENLAASLIMGKKISAWH